MAEFSGRNLTLLTVGGLLAFSALKGRSLSHSVRNFVTGNDPGGSADLPVVAPVDTGVNSPDFAATPNLGNSAASNRALGRMLAATYGWGTGNEWVALDALWTRESGWSNTAENSSSKAYGISQALPPTKLPKAGQPSSLGGSSSASAQIAWGLAYIHSRYGDPVKAEQHETQAGWY